MTWLRHLIVSPLDGRGVFLLQYGVFDGIPSGVNINFFLQIDLDSIQPSTNAFFDGETLEEYELILDEILYDKRKRDIRMGCCLESDSD